MDIEKMSIRDAIRILRKKTSADVIRESKELYGNDKAFQAVENAIEIVCDAAENHVDD